MKALITIATFAFWAIFALALVGEPLRDEASPAPPASAAPVFGPAAGTGISRDEVAAHNHADDCWMIIDAQVYDFTTYIPLHPAAPESMLKYCGRDGSEGFLTKDRGRAHSSRARGLMANYLLGPLKP